MKRWLANWFHYRWIIALGSIGVVYVLTSHWDWAIVLGVFFAAML